MTDLTLPPLVSDLYENHGYSLMQAWREYRGLSADRVARALCVRENHFLLWEQNSNPCNDVLQRLSIIYNCSPAQLLD